ncbi:hypothetical protein SAMN05443665_1014108 [Actinomadura meyerae]|uniref:Uncharacterized protein n=1 Tax=Actinomadura meyerae TaxID=240840 RepID=A0A239JBH4_9ACTN|nr:hypothetical protein [Actinomadura meyerae]SNT03139.1 hypothetical protein SAMN05443665_1014108 [Actinomadura meyerae]
MTILSGLLGLVALAMMVALVVLAVRRDRDIRHNAPGAVVRNGNASVQGHARDRSAPPAVR